MHTKDINTIISKYLDDEATVAEETFLLEWIKAPDNRKYFEDYIKTQTWVAYSYETSTIEKQLHALSIEAPVNAKGSSKNLLRYAVLVMALFSTAFFLYIQPDTPGSDVLNRDIITLEVNNGASQYYSLENPQEFFAANDAIGLEAGSMLQYRPDEASANELHTVHVPYGKIFKVELSDGSVVQLNSGSRFTYPASFKGHDSRSVSLVGEGYFNIAKSTIPFRVRTENLTTEVLGTVFNISAYENDASNEVILVEGSVRLFQDSNPTLQPKTLSPNQKANALATDDAFLIETIDIKDHLGWTDGDLVFFKDNMATIFKKLERKFNIRIENNYPKLESLSFSGRFIKKETLEEVLGTMRAHTYFSYSITDTNTLIIYEPDKLESL